MLVSDRIASLKRPGLLLFCIVFLFSATLLSHGKNTGQGDEPHYMMIAHSLLFDRDLDLRNNYDDKSNIIFEGRLVEAPHTRNWHGRSYSTHSPGLPLAALPAFAVSYFATSHSSDVFLHQLHLTRWTLLKLLLSLFMILLTASLAVMAYRYTAGFTGQPFALLATLACFLSCPLLPMGFLFFTEMPAAFLAFVGFRDTGGDRTRSLLARSVAISYLPFVHVKYVLLSLALLAILVADCRAGERRWRKIGMCVGIFAAAQLAFTLINYHCFGTIAPQASIGGGVTVAYRMWGKGWLGLALDQEFGLLWVAPIYLLSIAGGFAFWQSGRRKQLLRFTLPVLAYLVAYANFPMWWGGWSPSARFLAPILVLLLPLVAIAMQVFWQGALTRRLALALLVYQFVLAAYLWQHPKLMWNHADGRSDLFSKVSFLLPSVIRFDTRDTVLSAAWIVVLFALGFFTLRAGVLRTYRSSCFSSRSTS